MLPKLSVILCTHNPRQDYLERTFEGLKCQTLPKEQWEFLLIDNLSDLPLEQTCDLSWHSRGRFFREEELGLTQARLAGIAESRADLLVFVDDDNVLKEDYLERALELSQSWPILGAWSGRVVPQYEVQPVQELIPHLWRICIREVTEDVWGNEGSFGSTPWGAGMCVRKNVAEHYASETRKSDLKAMLDRRGQNLASTGDVDLALTSLKLGLGTGVFAVLEVVHLIPARRVTREYLLRLIEDSAAGSIIYSHSKGLESNMHKSFIDKVVAEYKFLRANELQRDIESAFRRGRRKGKQILENLTRNSRND
jgi:glycosyltransferase involved in cell wall biosynthesis